MSGIFISYRRKDAGGYAGRLHEELARHYGREAVFMDIDSIGGGVDFRQRIHEALEASDVALVLIGDAWTGPSPDSSRRIDSEDDLVRREVAAALAHDRVAVVPVLIEEARLPAAAQLPGDIARIPDLEICQLREREWTSDVRRIFRAIDANFDAGTLRRARRRVLHSPVLAGLAALAALAALLLLAAVAIVLFAGDGSENERKKTILTGNCKNLSIPQDSRDQLSDAAGTSKPATKGSVYYGSCGGKDYALASFPDGSKDAFVQSGLEWVDLGPAAAECDQIPSELLETWTLAEC